MVVVVVVVVLPTRGRRALVVMGRGEIWKGREGGGGAGWDRIQE